MRFVEIIAAIIAILQTELVTISFPFNYIHCVKNALNHAHAKTMLHCNDSPFSLPTNKAT